MFLGFRGFRFRAMILGVFSNCVPQFPEFRDHCLGARRATTDFPFPGHDACTRPTPEIPKPLALPPGEEYGRVYGPALAGFAWHG